MSSSMFQQAFHGGDKCRVSCLASAIQSALHWNASAKPAYLKPNSDSIQTNQPNDDVDALGEKAVGRQYTGFRIYRYGYEIFRMKRNSRFKSLSI